MTVGKERFGEWVKNILGVQNCPDIFRLSTFNTYAGSWYVMVKVMVSQKFIWRVGTGYHHFLFFHRFVMVNIVKIIIDHPAAPPPRTPQFCMTSLNTKCRHRTAQIWLAEWNLFLYVEISFWMFVFLKVCIWGKSGVAGIPGDQVHTSLLAADAAFCQLAREGRGPKESRTRKHENATESKYDAKQLQLQLQCCGYAWQYPMLAGKRLLKSKIEGLRAQNPP